MATDTPPDYVNAVPDWYDPDWPETQRCQYVFQNIFPYEGQWVAGRPCGYPTEPGHDRCLFHLEGQKDWARVREEIEKAVAAGAYLGEAHLEGASLDGANLSSAELCEANLSCANLEGADLSSAVLFMADLSCANLRVASLSEVAALGAKFSNAVLWGAEFKGEANLLSADLCGAWLTEATFSPETNLDGVRWWPDDKRRWWERVLHLRPPMLLDERLARDDQEWDKYRKKFKITANDRPRFANCEGLYRQIKRAYIHSGQYDEAGKFHIREMECKRAQLPRFSPHRAVYATLHFLCDYFENWFRAAVISAIVILVCAGIHGLLGLRNSAGDLVLLPVWRWGEASNPTVASLVAPLYFSLITFTATGYGDYLPHGWPGQIFAGFEAAFGVFMMALILVCLSRRYGRA